MIPSAFAYETPSTVEEAVALLAEHGDEAKILAGGHSLIPLMKLRLAIPEVLIDIGNIEGLSGISTDNGRVMVGAGTTHSTLEDSETLGMACPLLQQTAAIIGDRQVRNLGTIGGSLAHGDPAADLPAAVLALEAELTAVSANGSRTIAADSFFTGPLMTALGDDELLTTITVPATSGQSGAAYVKNAHPASGYAICGVAAIVTVGADGKCERARIGITGAGGTPMRAMAVEAALTGQELTADNIGAATDQAAEGLDLNDDLFASAEYRGHLVRVYTRRAVEQAAAQAGS